MPSSTGGPPLAQEDDNARHGYFTLAAIQGLKGKAENSEHMIRAYGLGAYLAEEVRRLSRNHQEPEFNSGLGDVVIVKH